MGENSHIQWTDHTFNPWEGCTKKSPGCANCYAKTRDDRFHDGVHWGPGAERKRTSEDYWKQPLGWNRKAAQRQLEFDNRWDGTLRQTFKPDSIPERPRNPRVFCASLADWLDEEAKIEDLADLLKLIHDTPNLDWLLLTKRPENWEQRILAAYVEYFNRDGDPFLASWFRSWLKGNPPANVWIGTTVENQAMADERIPLLLSIPAKVRFLSCEPLLEAIEFSDVSRRADAVQVLGKKALTGIHWIICGGESGPGARFFDVRAARSLRNQCKAAGVAFFMKQFGAHPITGDPEPTGQFRTNKQTGRRQMEVTAPVLQLKDRSGGDITEFPEDLRIRDFPASRRD